MSYSEEGDTIPRLVASLLEELEDSRASVKAKYLLTSRILSPSRVPFDRGRQPFQDFGLLVTLRDYIMHLRPAFLTRKEESWVPIESRLWQELRSRGLIRRDVPPNVATDLLFEIDRPEVSHWALMGAGRMAQAFIEMLRPWVNDDEFLDEYIKRFSLEDNHGLG